MTTNVSPDNGQMAAEIDGLRQTVDEMQRLCDSARAALDRISALRAELREELFNRRLDALADLMGRISEEGWAATWMMGIEFDLWAKASGDPDASRYYWRSHGISQRDIDTMKQLSDQLGGWFDGCDFVPLVDWVERYEADKLGRIDAAKRREVTR